MSSRNEANSNETRELDSSDEETPINPEVRILSRIFGVHRASVASMPGTSGAGHGAAASPAPAPRRTPRERDRMFWTLLGNSNLMLNARCRGGASGARAPRPAAFADLLEPDRRTRFTLTHPPSPAGSYPANSASLSSLHCSLRNLLRSEHKRPPSSPSGNVAGPSARPVLVLRAAAGSSRGGDTVDCDHRDRSDRSDRRDRGDRGDRSSRGDRSDRGDPSDRVVDHSDRTDRSNRGDPSDSVIDHSDRGDRSNRSNPSDRDDRVVDHSDRGDRSNRSNPSDRGDRSDRGERGDRSATRDREVESLILDDIEDVSEVAPRPPPAFSPRPGTDYFGNEPLQAEEPLNMSSGALLEEEILEVQDCEPERAPRAGADVPAESAETSAETSQPRGTKRKREEASQQRGTKRKREVTGEAPDSALALNQSILRLLECPVCMEWMEPPIAQCRRGHLVCGTCRKRLDTCPVCRTPFSSVRNRAMEDVAGVLRYPCRHGCGRWLRAPRRHRHEASCAARRHACPLPACRAAPPMARSKLATHCQAKHPESFKTGTVHPVSLGVRTEQHVQWVVAALGALFHVRVDMDVRAWGVCALVQLLGPQDQAHRYTYEVTVNGRHNGRRLVYRRATHSDLENPVLNTSRQDCFHLTLDQALNYLRFKNEHSETDKNLELTITLAEAEPEEEAADDD